MDAIPHIRGKWVLMGDADCTYDFRLLAPFVERFREGYEYVMGSRWKGSIEPGAMPPPAPVLRHAVHDLDPQPALRQPSSPTSTAACAASRATRSSGWTCSRSRGSTRPRWCSSRCTWSCAPPRCPVTFLKDREGRLSHHKRSGWFSPWQAAWINLRAMFVYGADFFVLRPGLVLLALGAAADAAAGVRARRASARSRCRSTTMLLGPDRSRSSACSASSSAASPRCCSTTPAGRNGAGCAGSRTPARSAAALGLIALGRRRSPSR